VSDSSEENVRFYSRIFIGKNSVCKKNESRLDEKKDPSRIVFTDVLHHWALMTGVCHASN
jgi:hypothetical protein